jgi:hypothetical protein
MARALFGGDATYLGLPLHFRTDLDILEADAFHEVSNLVKWWIYSNPAFEAPGDATGEEDTIPAVFNELFRTMWIAKGMTRFRNTQAGVLYFREHVAPLFERAALHFEDEFHTTSGVSRTFTLSELRRSVIATLLRQRTPVVPPFIQSNRVIHDEYVKLWDERRWTWRVRHKEVTIQTSGQVDLPGGDNDSLDGFASKHFTILLSNGQRSKIYWLDSERWAEAAARYDGDTGRPRFFFIENMGVFPHVIRFLPTPDIAYTAFVNVFIGPPTLAADDDGAAFDAMPTAFRAHLRNRVIGAMMSEWGREDADTQRWERKVEKERQTFGPEWDYAGSHEYSARGHHGHQFISMLSSYRGVPVVGQID